MNDRPSTFDEIRILRLRRCQVRSVAIGTLGALVLLAGAVAKAMWLFIAGAIVFGAALLAVFAFGAVAIWRRKSSRGL